MVVVNQVPAMLLHASDRPLLEILQRESEEAMAHLALAAQGQLDGLDHARKQIERLRGLESASVVEFRPGPRPGHLRTGDPGARVVPAAGNASQLATLIADAPLVVCVGPGGVGKTTFQRCWPCARPQPGGVPWC